MHPQIKEALAELAKSCPQHRKALFAAKDYDGGSTAVTAVAAVAFSANDVASYRHASLVAAACVYADKGNMSRALQPLAL